MKLFKIVRLGQNMLVPVQIAERHLKVELAGREMSFYPLGQELERTYAGEIKEESRVDGGVTESWKVEEIEEGLIDQEYLIKVSDLI